MFYLTGFGHSELRIDIADFENGTAYASYGLFAVGLDSVNPDEDGYVLTVDHYSGTAGTAAYSADNTAPSYRLLPIPAL